METHPVHAESQRTRIPAELESPRAKLVYLYLQTNGSTHISTIADELTTPKIALYGILRTLRERGLVAHSDEHYALS